MSTYRFFRVARIGLCASLLLLFALTVGTAPHAIAAGAVTETTTEHIFPEFTEIVPCVGEDLYDITVTYNTVEHTTTGPKSVHFTFTQTGTFVAVPRDSSLLTYTGHFTEWGGFNENARTRPAPLLSRSIAPARTVRPSGLTRLSTST
jgi:hypothetical protein